MSPNSYIYNVEDEYNGVVIEGEFYEKQYMFGKGAGGFPTGSSVLSDITARVHGYKYEYKKRTYFNRLEFTNDVVVKIYLRYKNVIDFEHFDFETIDERYMSSHYNYVVGTISLENLKRNQKLIGGLDVFVAFLGFPTRNSV